MKGPLRICCTRLIISCHIHTDVYDTKENEIKKGRDAARKREYIWIRDWGVAYYTMMWYIWRLDNTKLNFYNICTILYMTWTGRYNSWILSRYKYNTMQHNMIKRYITTCNTTYLKLKLLSHTSPIAGLIWYDTMICTVSIVIYASAHVMSRWICHTCWYTNRNSSPQVQVVWLSESKRQQKKKYISGNDDFLVV